MTRNLVWHPRAAPLSDPRQAKEKVKYGKHPKDESRTIGKAPEGRESHPKDESRSVPNAEVLAEAQRIVESRRGAVQVKKEPLPLQDSQRLAQVAAPAPVPHAKGTASNASGGDDEDSESSDDDDEDSESSGKSESDDPDKAEAEVARLAEAAREAEVAAQAARGAASAIKLKKKNDKKVKKEQAKKGQAPKHIAHISTGLAATTPEAAPPSGSKQVDMCNTTCK